jgi:SAM-dependent methyltransferase
MEAWRDARAADPRAAKQTYRLARCSACGTAVTLDRSDEEAGRLYAGGAYAPMRGVADVFVRPLRAAGERVALRSFSGASAGASVLEIGAGDGWLVTALRERGCSVTGIEPFAQPPDGALVAHREVTEDDFAAGPYDIVVFWHVLEHLSDPVGALRSAAGALTSDGRVVVSVPTLDSLQARLGGDRWFHQDVPRHAVHFTRDGLERLFERSGLAIAQIHDFVPDQNLLGMTQTLLNTVTRDVNVGFRLLKGDRDGMTKSDVVVSALAAAPAAILGLVLESIAMLAGRGGAVAVEATRGRSP